MSGGPITSEAYDAEPTSSGGRPAIIAGHQVIRCGHGTVSDRRGERQ
jgi:hypothetical protein